MADKSLRTLGEALRGDVRAWLQALGTGWLEYQQSTDQDWRALDALAAELAHIFQPAAEWIALDTWLTSGFMPMDLFGASEASSTEQTAQAIQTPRRAAIQPGATPVTPELGQGPKRSLAGREMAPPPLAQRQPGRPQAGVTFWPAEAGRAQPPMVPPAASPWFERAEPRSDPWGQAPAARGDAAVDPGAVGDTREGHIVSSGARDSRRVRPAPVPSATAFPVVPDAAPAAPVLREPLVVEHGERTASGRPGGEESDRPQGVVRTQEMADSQVPGALGQPAAVLLPLAGTAATVPTTAQLAVPESGQGRQALAALRDVTPAAEVLPVVPGPPLPALAPEDTPGHGQPTVVDIPQRVPSPLSPPWSSPLQGEGRFEPQVASSDLPLSAEREEERMPYPTRSLDAALAAESKGGEGPLEPNQEGGQRPQDVIQAKVAVRGRVASVPGQPAAPPRVASEPVQGLQALATWLDATPVTEASSAAVLDAISPVRTPGDTLAAAQGKREVSREPDAERGQRPPWVRRAAEAAGSLVAGAPDQPAVGENQMGPAAAGGTSGGRRAHPAPASSSAAGIAPPTRATATVSPAPPHVAPQPVQGLQALAAVLDAASTAPAISESPIQGLSAPPPSRPWQSSETSTCSDETSSAQPGTALPTRLEDWPLQREEQPVASAASGAAWERPATASNADREPLVVDSGRVNVPPSARNVAAGATPQAQDHGPRSPVAARPGQRREARSALRPAQPRRVSQPVPGQGPRRQTTLEELLPGEVSPVDGLFVESRPIHEPPADVAASEETPHTRTLEGYPPSQQPRPESAPSARTLRTNDSSALAPRIVHLTEDIDLDEILEALAREIQQEYRRFYGD